jgi:hypothetical protein
MYDWKDDILLLNGISQRLFGLAGPAPIPVDKETLTLIEKSVLKTQQQALQGAIDVIKHRLEQLEASDGPTGQRVKVS